MNRSLPKLQWLTLTRTALAVLVFASASFALPLHLCLAHVASCATAHPGEDGLKAHQGDRQEAGKPCQQCLALLNGAAATALIGPVALGIPAASLALPDCVTVPSLAVHAPRASRAPPSRA